MLPVGAAGPTMLAAPGFGAQPPDAALPADYAPGDMEPNATAVRVLTAGEYELFTEESQQRFWATGWKISGQSNRAGFRLGGQPLEFAKRLEMRSHGIVPGIVQVPPSGEPIIQMSDAHTAQAPLGSRLRFVPVAYRDALAAVRQSEAWVASLRRLSGQYRSLCGMGRRP